MEADGSIDGGDRMRTWGRRFGYLLLALTLAGCTSMPVGQKYNPAPMPNASGQTLPAAQGAPQSVPATSGAIQSYFTKNGGHPEKALTAVMGGATKSLDIAIYSLTLPEIVQAIVAAKQRGVVVRVITDDSQAKGASQSTALRTLLDAGIPVKQNTHSGLMHLKVTIADRQVVTTGSFNYSNAASTVNDEVLVVLRDAGLAESWSQEFQRMWDDKAKFESLK
jgi:phosphatidylserine/phosphatidylglycerophosphate/cardiolipin synthase-like enzyme